jgi:agmatinase
MRSVVQRHLAILACLCLAGPAWAQVGLLDSETETQAPIREGEKPVIPLDTGDPTYNAWKQLRDFSKDPKREPGPINVQKYDFGFSWFGIPAERGVVPVQRNGTNAVQERFK